MKTLAFGIFILALFLTACAPPTPAVQSKPTADQPLPTSEGPAAGDGSMSPAQTAALTLLSSTLNLPAGQISLVSTEAVIWSDGCLGVHRPDVMCTQALVEGFKIVFDVDGKEYEVHTNETGSAAVIASGLDVNSLIEVVLIKQLAENLGLDERGISVVGNEPAEFSDACLGVMMQDVMCAEVITPGRVIVLESDGVQYEYRVSDDGRLIQPATLALTWSRDGGIAGFCDRLTVFLSGEVYGNQCKLQEGAMSTLANLLTAQERSQFAAWVAEYGQLTLDASDPAGVADGMSLVLVFYGNGNLKPSEDAQGELFAWAQELYREVSR